MHPCLINNKKTVEQCLLLQNKGFWVSWQAPLLPLLIFEINLFKK